MNKVFYTYEQLKEMFYESNLDNTEFVIDQEQWIEYSYNSDIYYISVDDYDTYRNKRTKKVSNEELDFTIQIEHYYNDIVKDYKREVKLELQEPFETHYKKYRGINYTADFLLFTKDNREILVEIKGYIQRDKVFKYKIYDFLINKLTDYEYYVVKLRGNEKRKDKTAYLYNQGVKNKIVEKRTTNNFRTLVLEKIKD